MKPFLLFAISAFTLFAADVTGNWTGNLLVPNSEGQEQSRSAHLVLKQEGSKLTGTAGPDASQQHPIQNGKIDNDVLTFEVPAGETLMKFSLKLEGDEIKGAITREHEGQVQTAKLSVRRQP